MMTELDGIEWNWIKVYSKLESTSERRATSSWLKTWQQNHHISVFWVFNGSIFQLLISWRRLGSVVFALLWCACVQVRVGCESNHCLGWQLEARCGSCLHDVLLITNPWFTSFHFTQWQVWKAIMSQCVKMWRCGETANCTCMHKANVLGHDFGLRWPALVESPIDLWRGSGSNLTEWRIHC